MDKSLKSGIDWAMALIIFLVSIIELISWRLSFGQAANITDIGNGYLIWYYPLLSSLTIWLFSVFMLLKIIIFSHCIYTNIVTIVYFLIQTLNVSAFFFQFGGDFYNRIVYPIFVMSIIFIILIKIVRWLSKSQRQQS